jgi:endonuclease YncB( thermonuclease family)
MEAKHAFSLSLLITLLIASNIFVIKTFNSRQTINVLRVIDGDTLTTQDNLQIRLANINAPEKNSPFYNESKNFLSKYENQTLNIKVLGTDKYGRTLAKIYASQYLNLEIVRQGYASKFLVDVPELKKFNEAESEAIENERGQWKKSPHSSCIKSIIKPKEETLTLFNSCPSLNLENWRLKDESRKEFKFPSLSFSEINLHSFNGSNNETDIFWNSKQNIWNNDRDTLYLFDSQNNIAHYNSYGY